MRLDLGPRRSKAGEVGACEQYADDIIAEVQLAAPESPSLLKGSVFADRIRRAFVNCRRLSADVPLTATLATDPCVIRVLRPRLETCIESFAAAFPLIKFSPSTSGLYLRPASS